MYYINPLLRNLLLYLCWGAFRGLSLRPSSIVSFSVRSSAHLYQPVPILGSVTINLPVLIICRDNLLEQMSEPLLIPPAYKAHKS